MPGYRAALLNFTKGEISPEVQARFDLAAYQAAAKRAYNVKIKRTGGLYKRMGTRFIVEALSPASHPVPFQFSDDQAYLLEMAQETMRPMALGGVVLEDGLKITAISLEAQAQITAAFHGYTVGKTVYFADVPGMVEINDRFLKVVAVIDDNNFRVAFDSRTATPFAGGDSGIVRTGSPTPPPAPPSTPVPTPPPAPPVVGSGSGGTGYKGGVYHGGDGAGGGAVSNL